MEITVISQMFARSMAPFALCRQSLPHYDLSFVCPSVFSLCSSLFVSCVSILHFPSETSASLSILVEFRSWSPMH